MTSLQLQESVSSLLQDLTSLNVLKKMFWSQLNYERVNRTLSPRNWTESVVKELKEDPLLSKCEQKTPVKNSLANINVLTGLDVLLK